MTPEGQSDGFDQGNKWHMILKAEKKTSVASPLKLSNRSFDQKAGGARFLPLGKKRSIDPEVVLNKRINTGSQDPSPAVFRARCPTLLTENSLRAKLRKYGR